MTVNCRGYSGELYSIKYLTSEMYGQTEGGWKDYSFYTVALMQKDGTKVTLYDVGSYEIEVINESRPA